MTPPPPFLFALAASAFGQGIDMSSTNRGSKRALDDHYATHPELAGLITDQLHEDYIRNPDHVFVPGCGEGGFLQAAGGTWPEADLVGMELNENLVRVARRKGFTVHNENVLEADLGEYDVVVTNPPFKDADAFLTTLRQHVRERGILAFLLRLNFLGGQRRYQELWSGLQPDHVYVMPARPGFTPDGRTDSVEYMVAVFTDNDQPQTTLSFLDNRDVQRRWDDEVHVDLGHYVPSSESRRVTREEAMATATEDSS